MVRSFSPKATASNVGRYQVRSVMKAEGLEAIRPKRHVPQTTDSRHSKTASPNLLKGLQTEALNAGEAIVGWQISERMPAELVMDALKMGLRRGYVKRRAIIHTDRGSQYASKDTEN